MRVTFTNTVFIRLQFDTNHVRVQIGQVLVRRRGKQRGLVFGRGLCVDRFDGYDHGHLRIVSEHRGHISIFLVVKFFLLEVAAFSVFLDKSKNRRNNRDDLRATTTLTFFPNLGFRLTPNAFE